MKIPKQRGYCNAALGWRQISGISFQLAESAKFLEKLITVKSKPNFQAFLAENLEESE